GNTFTYSLVTGTGDDDNAAFNIVSDELRTNTLFDFQTKNSYTILVRATDQGGLSIEQIFAVSIEKYTGDMDGDGILNNFDIYPFELALTDPIAYEFQYGLSDYQQRGDLNHDGLFDNFDIWPFELGLTGGSESPPAPFSLAPADGATDLIAEMTAD